MRFGKSLRLVWLNMIQNKFKVMLTSVGIIAGAATIVMVLAIGKGGQMDVADQFKNLNAGAIDISYEGGNSAIGGNKEGGFPQGMPSGGMPEGFSKSSGRSSGSGSGSGSGGSGMPSFMNGNGFPGGSGLESRTSEADRMNLENITLSLEDVEELETFVPDISDVTISYSVKQTVDGGELEEETSYTIAGVQPEYDSISNLSLAAGEFLIDSNEENKEKVCVLGYTAAKEIFGSVEDAYAETIYIDGRPYVVNGILEEVGTVASGISPDEAVFIPYSTGIKYLSANVRPTITVIAQNVNQVDEVIENIKTVLAETYPNAEFTISDAGSKMEAASASNDILTILLAAMAAIVFFIGGIGIMNVLFVTVRERTKEIGILKAMGCSKKDILAEFLLEAGFISIIGGVLGVGLSFGIAPVAEYFQVRVEMSAVGAGLAVAFAILTGTVFGFYPAWKASRLVPVQALSEE